MMSHRAFHKSRGFPLWSPAAVRAEGEGLGGGGCPTPHLGTGLALEQRLPSALKLACHKQTGWVLHPAEEPAWKKSFWEMHWIIYSRHRKSRCRQQVPVTRALLFAVRTQPPPPSSRPSPFGLSFPHPCYLGPDFCGWVLFRPGDSVCTAFPFRIPAGQKPRSCGVVCQNPHFPPRFLGNCLCSSRTRKAWKWVPGQAEIAGWVLPAPRACPLLLHARLWMRPRPRRQGPDPGTGSGQGAVYSLRSPPLHFI